MQDVAAGAGARVRDPRWAIRAFMAVVFVSGFSALGYQIAWERLFVTLFGIDFYCISAITTGFLAGLGIGAWWFGRLADRLERVAPLTLYAGLEIGIGLFGLASPVLFTGLYDLSAALQNAIEDPWAYFFVSFCVVFAATVVPTALMGGTLPVMVKHLYRSVADTGAAVGGFYAANTFGAVAGSFVTCFLLISLLGVDGTIQLAGLLNLAIGLACLAASRGAGPPSPPARSLEVEEPALPGRSSPLLLLLYGASSFAALGYQLLWYRIAALAGWEAMAGLFGWVLGFYLLGVVIGSAIFARWAGAAVRWGIGLFASLQFLTAAAGVVGFLLFREISLSDPRQQFNALVPLLHRLHEIDVRELPWDMALVGEVMGRLGFLAVWTVKFVPLITLPMVVQGICFPLVSRLCLQSYGRSGGDIGWVYLVSILGSVAGAFGMGFLLLPLIGLRGSFILLTAMGIAVGLIAWAMTRAETDSEKQRLNRRWTLASAAAGMVALAVLLLLPGNLYRYVLGRNVTTVVEGITGAAYIVETDTPHGREASVYLNDIGHGKIAPTMDSYDYIEVTAAVTLHPAPRNALLIGVGNGSVLVAAEKYRELKRIDVVEISRELVPAIRLRPDFPIVHAAVNSPKVNLIHADGRMFLNRTDERYDIIATAPFFPWNNHAGYLYSLEMLELIRSRLNPGGIFCLINDHWFQAEMQMAQIRTFQAAFPHFVTLTDRQILCGSATPMRLDTNRIRETWELNKDWLTDPPGREPSYDLDRPGAVLRHFRADERAFTDIAAFPINRDLDPRSEFWFLQARKIDRTARALLAQGPRRNLDLTPP